MVKWNTGTRISHAVYLVYCGMRILEWNTGMRVSHAVYIAYCGMIRAGKFNCEGSMYTSHVQLKMISHSPGKLPTLSTYSIYLLV